MVGRRSGRPVLVRPHDRVSIAPIYQPIVQEEAGGLANFSMSFRVPAIGAADRQQSAIPPEDPSRGDQNLGGKTVSLGRLHKRAGWLVAFAVVLAATNLLACNDKDKPKPQAQLHFARLNLPSGYEPAKHAPKEYRAKKHYDPDYYKHPSRWHRKLRARYA